MKKPSKPKNRRSVPFTDWEPLFSLQRFVWHPRRRGRVLGLQLIQKGHAWTTLAFETINPKKLKGSARDGIEAVLGDHSHQYLGEFDRMVDAIDALDAYGRRWRTNDLPAHDKCGCGPIEAAGAITPATLQKAMKARRGVE